MAETGALIAAEPEPQALAAALARLVNDPAERRRLAQAGREFAQRFTSAQVGAAWRKALESARNR
jgi:glycosyltransferase involved in cell wall biosynthesis